MPRSGSLRLVDTAEAESLSAGPASAPPRRPWRTALPVILALCLLSWAAVVLAWQALL